MITIDAIKTMFDSSDTLEEYKEIYDILNKRKAQMNRSYWDITEKAAARTEHVPLDIDSLKEYVASISTEEREILEDYARTQIQLRAAIMEIDELLKDTHLKIRGFYDSNL